MSKIKDGFVKVAACNPEIRTGDIDGNTLRIIKAISDAAAAGVKLCVFPELCVTGADCGDLFFQPVLLGSAERALLTIIEWTAEFDMIIAVGVPLRVRGRLFNCGVLFSHGEVICAAPKNYLTSKEKRWFSAPVDKTDMDVVELHREDGTALYLTIGARPISVGGVDGLRLGIEIGTDLTAPNPPSTKLSAEGANVIMNLSSSLNIIGVMDHCRELVKVQSARLHCGYILSDRCVTFIGENGKILASGKGSEITVTELDIYRIEFRRRYVSNSEYADGVGSTEVNLTTTETALTRHISAMPFVPEDLSERRRRCEEVYNIQVSSLKQRMKSTASKCAVVGVSGDLNSTLALLAAKDACTRTIAVSMPCFGTTSRTKNNAERLAKLLGVEFRTIDISESVCHHLSDIGHSTDVHDIAFENAQARERTQVLMDIANMNGGIVIGTGDMSELALGWCTYNGDQMSMYGINAGIPKTLIKEMVLQYSIKSEGELRSVLSDIVETPISPELLAEGQSTEKIIGPYILHDFFLYYFVRWGFAPEKLLRLAEYAMGNMYTRGEIMKWLRVFFERFFSQQYKRTAVPDAPEIGSVSLSKNGFNMVSDANAALWINKLEELY